MPFYKSRHIQSYGVMLIEDPIAVKSPIISVIVITYNQEGFIEQCIESILSQKLNVPFEIVIADDDSKDATRDILKRYQNQNPQIIRLLLQETNQGISKNYSDVLSLARGKYIAQVAGDDFWCNEEKLQIQYNYMSEHPNCGLCYTNVKAADASGKIVNEDYLKDKPLSKSFEDHLISPGFIAPLSWMFLSDVAHMYEDRGFADESVAIALDAFANYDVAHLEVCTAVYRMHGNSVSSFISAEYYFRQS